MSPRCVFLVLTLLPTCVLMSNGFPGERNEGKQSCSTAINGIFTSAYKGIPWAVEMLDAWGKPPTGMLRQGFQFQHKLVEVPRDAIRMVGNYDQCLTLQPPENYETQYCNIHFKVEKIGIISLSPGKELVLGVCAPSTCTPDALESAVQPFLDRIYLINSTINAVNCYERSFPLSYKAMVAIVTLVFLLALVVAGTAYDLICSNSETVSGEDKAAGDMDVKCSVMPLNNGYERIGRVLLCFSVSKNMSKLLSTTQTGESIDCIHGVRVLTTLWVMLGHVLMEGDPLMDNVRPFVKEGNKAWFHPIANCFTLGVDTFFVISGVLTANNTIKKLQSNKPSVEFFKNIFFHRYWRLTPPFALVMLVYISLFKYVTKGPLMVMDGAENNECEHTWWTNLLHINSYVRSEDMCLRWSWSVTDDMLFYLVSPIALLPLLWYGWFGAVFPVAMMVSSAAIGGYVTYRHQLPAFPNYSSDFASYFSLYYVPAHTRIGPYLVGVLTGYAFGRTDSRTRMSKLTVVLGWILTSSIALAVFVTCYVHNAIRPLSNEETALVNATHRICWGVFVAWVIYVCASENCDMVNRILSGNVFKPFAKLSYCFYLVHPIVLKHFYLTQRRLPYMNTTLLIYVSSGCLVISLCLSTMVHLVFEAPFLNLEWTFHSSRKNSKTKTT